MHVAMEAARLVSLVVVIACCGCGRGASEPSPQRVIERATQDKGMGNTLPCQGPNPQGCMKSGCAPGFRCDTQAGCASSSCTCSEAERKWVCTEDCAGGVCMAEDAGASK